jgi:tRNA(Ile)-lysidine synthase
LAEYASYRELSWVDDPSNASPAHLRNRVRHDLLPALQRANPALPAELLALAHRAAELRVAVDAIAATIVRLRNDGTVEVQLTDLLAGDEEPAALLWQSIAARIGVALDWRGTQRLTRFGAAERVGARIPLSGGYEAVRRSTSIVLRPSPRPSGPTVTLESSSATMYGVWRFRSASDATINGATVSDPWLAWLPADRALTVRAWQGGDRMVVSDDGRRRRVKRFFADRHVVAPDRDGWPVVVVDDEIIWIPGIRRGPAATARSGRPALCFICERVHS